MQSLLSGDGAKRSGREACSRLRSSVVDVVYYHDTVVGDNNEKLGLAIFPEAPKSAEAPTDCRWCTCVLTSASSSPYTDSLQDHSCELRRSGGLGKKPWLTPT